MSQENQVGSETIQEQDKMPLNTFTVGLGRASELRSGASFSNIGFDYLRRLNPKWELGVQLDIDWEKDFVQFEGVQVAGIVAFSVTQKWPVFAGLVLLVKRIMQKDFFGLVPNTHSLWVKSKCSLLLPGLFWI